MNKIFVINLNQKKQVADLVYSSQEKLENAELNEIIQWLRAELSIRGQDRVKNDLRGFLKSIPAHSYAKFQVKLEYDAHVLSVGGGGCLGYVSDYTIDSYHTFGFSNIEVYTPTSQVTMEQVKEKFQISSLYQIKSQNAQVTQTPSTQAISRASQAHTTNSQTQATAASASNMNNQYVAKYTARTPFVKTNVGLISPQILGTKA